MPPLSSTRIFDAADYVSLNTSRAAVVSRFLSEMKGPLNLRSAVDVGCGLGYFSELLRSLGLDVTALDGRRENTEEAARRNPEIRFHTMSAEDPTLPTLGKFDLVFCFGLLYHLENPFLAIRHLQAMTRRLLLVEAVIFPGEASLMGLVDEGSTEDQGLNHIAFYPTESCLVKMFYRSGFRFAYRFAPLPDHPGYRSENGLPRVRTMLAASFEPISSSQLEGVLEPITSIQPWDAANVARNRQSLSLSSRLRRSWMARHFLRKGAGKST
jgi:SAM-dependent methyltransferase